MKKFVLIFLGTIIGNYCLTQTTKTVVNTTAGYLSTKITTTERTTVTELIVSGPVDARDFKFLRDNMTALSTLDLQQANILAYTGKSGPNATGYDEKYGINNLPAFSFTNSQNLSGKTSLRFIKLPVNIKEIEFFALYNCKFLNNVTFPPTLLKINSFAFYGCEGISNVTLHDSLEVFGGSFGKCTSLSDITVGPAHKYYSNQGGLLINNYKQVIACPGGKSGTITIPETVNIISGNAFAGCNISSAIIPSSISQIYDGAFRDCSLLSSITIPSPVSVISSYTFDGCVLLSDITLPGSLTAISTYAFRNCKSLTNINIPNSVTVLANNSFADCTSLEKLNGGSGIKEIGTGAFRNCIKLKETPKLEWLDNIGIAAFKNCSQLKSVQLDTWSTYVGDSAFAGCTLLDSAIIHTYNYTNNSYKRLTTIYPFTFADCKSLRYVHIGSAINSLKNYAFSSSDSITTIEIMNQTPPEIFASTFDSIVESKAQLVVPTGTLDLYKNTSYWKHFISIKEAPTGTPEITENRLAIQFNAFNRILSVVNCENPVVIRLYDIKGRKLQETTTGLSNKIYIHESIKGLILIEINGKLCTKIFIQ